MNTLSKPNFNVQALHQSNHQNHQAQSHHQQQPQQRQHQQLDRTLHSVPQSVPVNNNNQAERLQRIKNQVRPNIVVPISGVENNNNNQLNQPNASNNCFSSQQSQPVMDAAQKHLFDAIQLDKIQAIVKNKVRQLRDSIANTPTNNSSVNAIVPTNGSGAVSQQNVNSSSHSMGSAFSATNLMPIAQNIDTYSTSANRNASSSNNTNNESNNDQQQQQQPRSYIRMQPQVVLDLTCEDGVVGNTNNLTTPYVSSHTNKSSSNSTTLLSAHANASNSRPQQMQGQNVLEHVDQCKSLLSPVIVKPESMDTQELHSGGESSGVFTTSSSSQVVGTVHESLLVSTPDDNAIKQQQSMIALQSSTSSSRSTANVASNTGQLPSPRSTTMATTSFPPTPAIPSKLIIPPLLSSPILKPTPSPVSSSSTSSLAAHNHSSSTNTSSKGTSSRKQQLPTLETVKVPLKNLKYSSLQLELGSFKCHRYNPQIHVCLDRLKRLTLQTETSERLISILTALCQVRQVPEVLSFFEINSNNNDNTLIVRPSENGHRSDNDNDDDNECGIGAVEESELVNAGKVTGDKLISIDGYCLYGKCLQVVHDILTKRFAQTEEAKRNPNTDGGGDHQLTLVFLRLPASVYESEPRKEEVLLKTCASSSADMQQQQQQQQPVISSRLDRMRQYALMETQIQRQHQPITQTVQSQQQLTCVAAPTIPTSITTTSKNCVSTTVSKSNIEFKVSNTPLSSSSASLGTKKVPSDIKMSAKLKDTEASSQQQIPAVSSSLATASTSFVDSDSAKEIINTITGAAVKKVTSSSLSDQSSIKKKESVSSSSSSTAVAVQPKTKSQLTSENVSTNKKQQQSTERVSSFSTSTSIVTPKATSQNAVPKRATAAATSSSTTTLAGVPTTIAAVSIQSKPQPPKSTVPQSAAFIASLEIARAEADRKKPRLLSSSSATSAVRSAKTVAAGSSSNVNNSKSNAVSSTQKSSTLSQKSGVISNITKQPQPSSSSIILTNISQKPKTNGSEPSKKADVSAATAASQKTVSSTADSQLSQQSKHLEQMSKNLEKMSRSLIVNKGYTMLTVPSVPPSQLSSSSSSSTAAVATKPMSLSNSGAITTAETVANNKRTADQMLASSSTAVSKAVVSDSNAPKVKHPYISNKVVVTKNAAKTTSSKSTVYPVNDDEEDEAWSDTDDKKYNSTYNDEVVTELNKRQKTKVSTASSSSSISPAEKRQKTSSTVLTSPQSSSSSSSSRRSNMSTPQQQSFEQRRETLLLKLLSKEKGCLIHVRPTKTSDTWHEAFLDRVYHDPEKDYPEWMYQVSVLWQLRNTTDVIDINPDLIEIAEEMKKRGRSSR